MADALPPNVIAHGEYVGMPASFSDVIEDCADFVDCADFAMYASLICTESVPVRLEK